jgi:hypothetical protein
MLDKSLVEERPREVNELLAKVGKWLPEQIRTPPVLPRAG